jgi:hypothetical protein
MLVVDVEKRLGDFFLSARFETGSGVTAVYGPSGAGKTTLVNMISGLVAPDRGRIVIDHTVLFDSAARVNVPPHGRQIGYVFQEGRLFPHLSVAHNLDYGRRMRGLPPDIAQMQRVVSLLDIGNLLDRRPGKLSGGERQRSTSRWPRSTSPASAKSCPISNVCATTQPASPWSMSAIRPPSFGAPPPRWCGLRADKSRQWAARSCSTRPMPTRCCERQ